MIQITCEEMQKEIKGNCYCTKELKKSKLPLIILFLSIFAVMGVVFTSSLIHEFVHIFQADKVYSICYDFNNNNSRMHVTGIFTDEAEKSESSAYFVQHLYFFILITIIFMFVLYFRINIFNKLRKK